VTRSPTTALGDALFHRLSGVVSSETVLAHVRKATQGSRTVFNCHPFQYGRWVFAHNGDIPNFEQKREALMAHVAPRFRRFIMGDTDSEVLFFLFLSALEPFGPLAENSDLESISCALKEAVNRARALCDTDGTRALLTVVATNGECLVAAQGGKELYFSTYKTRCSDRGGCANLSAACEAPSSNGRVNHFIVSSEPLQGENVWEALAAGDIIGVDARMYMRRSRLDHVALPVVA
jgi:glutamine amidotransferase